jgi:hypothetical protein
MPTPKVCILCQRADPPVQKVWFLWHIAVANQVTMPSNTGYMKLEDALAAAERWNENQYQPAMEPLYLIMDGGK